MFKQRHSTDAALEAEIARVHANLSDAIPDSEDYAAMMKQLSELYRLREPETRKPVSYDTLLAVGGNLVGIMMIVGHERAHLVNSKALSFIKTFVR